MSSGPLSLSMPFSSSPQSSTRTMRSQEPVSSSSRTSAASAGSHHQQQRRTKSVVNVSRLHRITVFELLTPSPGAEPPPGRFRSMRLRDLYNYVQRTIAGELVNFSTAPPDLLQMQPATKSGRPPLRRSISISEAAMLASFPKQRAAADAGAGAGDPSDERTVLGSYLHPRDMRRMVTPFSPSNQPAVIVRSSGGT